MGVLWTAMSFLIFRNKKSVPAHNPPNTDDTAAVKRLKEACQSGSAEQAKQALLDWARAHWPEKPPLTASEIAARTGSPALMAEADVLNHALYGENEEKWNGMAFWLAFKDAQTDEKKKQKGEKIPVPPLYPQ